MSDVKTPIPQKKEAARRITDAELSLLKNTFAERQDIFILMRKVFFQVKLSASEQKLLKPVFSSQPVLDIVRKIFLPEIWFEAPIGQQVDLWMTIEIKDKSIDELAAHIEARKGIIEFLVAGLYRLQNFSNENLNDSIVNFFVKGKDDKEVFVNLLTRNSFINHVEQQLNQINFLSGMKTETVEETKTRLAMNSNK